MMEVTIFKAGSGEGDKYLASSVEPFGAGCVVLAGAWSAEWNGQRQENRDDARTIILPAPAERGDRIEVRQAEG